MIQGTKRIYLCAHLHSRCHLLSRRIILRCESTQSQVKSHSKIDEKFHHEHQYKGETKFSMPKLIEPEPITSLNLLENIEKITKHGSFIGNLFLAKFDVDFLSWPVILRHRKQLIALNEQHEMITKTWCKIDKKQSTLDSLGFNKLFALSTTEMINVFEAIGASIGNNFSFRSRNQTNAVFNFNHQKTNRNMVVSEGENSYNEYNNLSNFQIVQSIVPLIIHNALSYKCIYKSENENIKQLFNTNQLSKVGFAYNESQPDLGSLQYNQWNSIAKITNDESGWVINGTKSRIFKDDYDYYVIFCKTSDVLERRTRPAFLKNDESFDGTVGLLVPKDLVKIENDDQDIFGSSYQKISFSDLHLPRDKFEIVKPQLNAINFFNIKGIGQLAVSAVLLGILKSSLRDTYDYVINEKIGLKDCEIIKKILNQATENIYCIESTLYLATAMFDAFKDETDCSLECLAVKILTNDLAHKVIRDLRSIHGSRYVSCSNIYDLINVFDSFLDCSINNRMFLALKGLHTVGEWRHDYVRKQRLAPLYPVHAIKAYIKQMRHRNDNEKLNLDLCGYLHPRLKSPADWLEYSVKRMDYAAEILLIRHGKKVTEKQIDLDRVAQMAIECFMMTCVLSRSSHGLCDGLINAEGEVDLAQGICQDKFIKIRSIMDALRGDDFFPSSNDYFVSKIHNYNIQNNGYFPTTTFDRIY